MYLYFFLFTDLCYMLTCGSCWLVKFFALFFLFFFFKQKTAYEMRISDWSSDVCSSDLLFDNFIRGSEAIVRGVEASGVRRLVVIGGAGSLFVAPDIQLVDTDLFAAHVTPNIALGARAARDALNTMRSNTTLDWTFVSRSEEHTSELPSLMRISYAV